MIDVGFLPFSAWSLGLVLQTSSYTGGIESLVSCSQEERAVTLFAPLISFTVVALVIKCFSIVDTRATLKFS
jgi:hypothetical protein